MSTLRVDNITDLGDDAVVTAGVVDSGSLPAGSILQFVRATDSTQRSTTSTSLVDVTGGSITITPTKSTSKILLVAQAMGQMVPTSSGSRGTLIWADSSNNGLMGPSTAAGRQGQFGFTYAGTPTDWLQVQPIAYDTPGTTSATTYKLRFLTDAGCNFKLMNDLQTLEMFALEIAA